MQSTYHSIIIHIKEVPRKEDYLIPQPLDESPATEDQA